MPKQAPKDVVEQLLESTQVPTSIAERLREFPTLAVNLAKVCPPLDGVNVDLEKRWAEGMRHHPESLKIMQAIMAIDYVFNDDYYSFRIGGDGDNGEQLLYVLDIYFEARDKNGDV